MNDTTTNKAIESLLIRLSRGDLQARDELIAVTYDRLQKLTRKMLRGYPIVRGWEQTDDVFQNAAMRLRRAMEQVQSATVEAFVGLAALQIRRELLDLARHYSARQRNEGHQAPPVGEGSHLQIDKPDSTFDPRVLALWTEFHRMVDTLDPAERAVVDLLWYEEMTQEEAAAVLQVDKSTVKRRWRAVRLKLAQALQQVCPEMWKSVLEPA